MSYDFFRFLSGLLYAVRTPQQAFLYTAIRHFHENYLIEVLIHHLCDETLVLEITFGANAGSHWNTSGTAECING